MSASIRIAHSPDADDAYMFWALAHAKVKTPLQLEHILKDIQTLNEWAMQGKYEVTAVSAHGLAYVSDKYNLLKIGASFGEGYGPIVVAHTPLSHKELHRAVIAIPGKFTSAFLALKLFLSETSGTIPTEEHFPVFPFDKILPAVKTCKVDAGVIIHEGQLTFAQENLHCIVDLGKWWQEQTSLPLPLGVNVVRKDLPEEIQKEIARCLRESILLAQENHDEALAYALQFGRGISRDQADRFVKMYVNHWTLNMGEKGVTAIKTFLTKGAQKGFIPEPSIHIAE
ncbi:MAG: MqnA/MqnD/SBP family protein [Candidatus Methanosuratincola sp.]